MPRSTNYSSHQTITALYLASAFEGSIILVSVGDTYYEMVSFETRDPKAVIRVSDNYSAPCYSARKWQPGIFCL